MTSTMNPILQDRRLLVVDDELAIRKALEQRFTEEGAAVESASGVQVARQALREAEFDLIILDHRLPDGTGLGLLENLRAEGCEAAIVMMTAYASPQDAVRAMKNGAADYVMKPFDLDEMVVVAARAVEHRALRSEVTRLRSRDEAARGVQALIGSSTATQELRDFVKRVAQSGAQTILISGESGTGKDLVARAIHYASEQQDAPFLNITCTALPEALLESELFGHEKGAFTDARQSKAGLFESANGGTIFLDEIGDMPLSLQAKLLRFLESKSFRRIGGLRELKVHVRVIAASNRNLHQAIESGDFRRDLFYRLNVIPIEIPPLRDRLADVPDLIEHFTHDFCRELRRPREGFSGKALDLLCQHPWPGNVRELRNCVERAVLLSQNTKLDVEDLPREIRGAGEGDPSAAGDRVMTLPPHGVVLDELIKDLLDQALVKSNGNKSRAATLLGIHRDQVRYWVKKYGLTRWIRTRAPAE